MSVGDAAIECNLRKYGCEPFSVAVVHGGPGAAGEMVPVASELSSVCGILEPIQKAMTITGQVEELKSVLENNGNLPVTLIGFSWGAWLSFIFSSCYSSMVKKLILIGSGPFEEKYAAYVQKTRYNRLNEDEKTEFKSILITLENVHTENIDELIARLGTLALKSDAFDPEIEGLEQLRFNPEIYKSVWPEAAKLRSNGSLLKLAKKIKCPVVAIHGEYDPHPADGVLMPLSSILKNFRLILLKKCGHKPWIERQARQEFFQILKEQLF